MARKEVTEVEDVIEHSEVQETVSGGMVLPGKQEMVKWVSNKLYELGHANPLAWESKLHVLPELHPGEPLPIDMQIVQINRALRYLLVTKPEINTIDTRIQIIDTDEKEYWQQLITPVLKFIVDNGY